MKQPHEPLAVRLYRRALILLPETFRRRCGPAMAAMLADEWRERRGIRRAVLLVRALGDLLWTALLERVRPLGGGQESAHQRGARGEGRSRLGVSWLDVKLGLRVLVKYPGLSLVAGLGMAVAIAMGTAWFGFTDALTDPTLPLDDGERVVSIVNRELGARASMNDLGFESEDPDYHSLHDFHAWRGTVRSVEDMGAFRTVRRNLILGEGAAQVVRVAEMSASGFRVARVAPALGRPLVEDDERRGAAPVVVIAHEEWQRRFGGEPDILGREIRLGRDLHTVVGVMPEGFRFPMIHRYWVPLRLSPVAFERGQAPSVHVFGRLPDGVPMERAQAELTSIGDGMAAAMPDSHGKVRPRVLPYVYGFLSFDEGPKPLEFYLLQNVYVLLLLLVALNVAVLIYARTATRAGEITVRTALGASRRRVVTQLFVEALVLALLAAGLGLAIGQAALRFVARIQAQDETPLPFWIDMGLSAKVVAYAVGLALLTAVVAGVLPALKATGKKVQAGLQQLTARGSHAELGRTWTLLIVVQVAIAVAALPYAAQQAGVSAANASAVAPFPAEEVLRTRLYLERDVSPMAADTAPEVRAFENRFAERTGELERRLEAEPGVAGVAVANAEPGEGPYRLVDSEAGQGAPMWVKFHDVDSDFFSVIGLGPLAGRVLTDGDARAGGGAVVVSRTYAESLGPVSSVVGQRLRVIGSRDPVTGEQQMGPWQEVVGVVPDFTVGNAPTLFAARSDVEAGATLIVRGDGVPTAALAATIRRVSAGIDPELQLRDLRTIAHARQQEQRAMGLVALGISAVMVSVLLLSAAGIYAMMSFTVAKRRREIGIRAALGADARHVLWGIFARAGTQLGAGAAAGIAIALALQRVAGDLSPALLAFAAGLMVLVGLMAAVGPARRGLGVHPMEALREE